MEIRNYIQEAEKITGSTKNLEEMLDLARGNLTDVKAGRRSLPVHACVKLADLVEADFREVVAASELATEKKAERREFWQKILGQSVTAGVVLAALTFNAPGEAEASTLSVQSDSATMYIMSNTKKLVKRALSRCINFDAGHLV